MLMDKQTCSALFYRLLMLTSLEDTYIVSSFPLSRPHFKKSAHLFAFRTRSPNFMPTFINSRHVAYIRCGRINLVLLSVWYIHPVSSTRWPDVSGCDPVLHLSV
ncbi:hypothetical protein CRENBAI_002883 [Crenichthys baileyi]|uniref:Uncharacterized protein n=1 Tax=Crenichthys baileyi TaxID=28760 RepID=A0AAV9QWZ1_9TELE